MPIVESLRASLGETPLRGVVQRVVAARNHDAGALAPPAERAKRRHLLGLLQSGGHRAFVESGTYLGDTVAFFVPYVDTVVSVEVDPALAVRAQQRFADEPKVEIIMGDAQLDIPRVVSALTVAPLVWLDGHWSGGQTGQGLAAEPAPTIISDLGRTGVPAGTTLVVDDLRLFGREPGFPSLEALVDGARAAFPDGRMTLGLDSLVVQV